MVGVQLQMPANNHAGSEQMTKVKKELQTRFGTHCQIMMDDKSSIKMKLHLEGSLGSLFTLTLTPNTGYIQVQGPADKVLNFAKHIQTFVGGDVYTSRQKGAAPHNPCEQVRANNDVANHPGASTEATDPGANYHGANRHEATNDRGTEQGAAGTGTSSSPRSHIIGNHNVQVGTVVINTPRENSQENATSRNGMSRLINYLRDFFWMS